MKRAFFAAVISLFLSCRLHSDTILIGLRPYLHDIDMSFSAIEIVEDSPDSAQTLKSAREQVALKLTAFPLPPVAGAATVVIPFGQAILDTNQLHLGIDFAAGVGTPVRAAGAGTIVARDYDEDLGNYIAVDHGDSIKTIYGHMSAFAGKYTGLKVKPGDVIGYVGITGLVTDPCVHFAIQFRYQYINPSVVLSLLK